MEFPTPLLFFLKKVSNSFIQSFFCFISVLVNVSLALVSSHMSPCSSRYLWSAHEIDEAEKATVLFAADVIYSDDLTDLFFATARKLLSSGAKKVLSYPASTLSSSKVLS